MRYGLGLPETLVAMIGRIIRDRLRRLIWSTSMVVWTGFCFFPLSREKFHSCSVLAGLLFHLIPIGTSNRVLIPLRRCAPV